MEQKGANGFSIKDNFVKRCRLPPNRAVVRRQSTDKAHACTFKVSTLAYLVNCPGKTSRSDTVAILRRHLLRNCLFLMVPVMGQHHQLTDRAHQCYWNTWHWLCDMDSARRSTRSPISTEDSWTIVCRWRCTPRCQAKNQPGWCAACPSIPSEFLSSRLGASWLWICRQAWPRLGSVVECIAEQLCHRGICWPALQSSEALNETPQSLTGTMVLFKVEEKRKKTVKNIRNTTKLITTSIFFSPYLWANPSILPSKRSKLPFGICTVHYFCFCILVAWTSGFTVKAYWKLSFQDIRDMLEHVLVGAEPRHSGAKSLPTCTAIWGRRCMIMTRAAPRAACTCTGLQRSSHSFVHVSVVLVGKRFGGVWQILLVKSNKAVVSWRFFPVTDRLHSSSFHYFFFSALHAFDFSSRSNQRQSTNTRLHHCLANFADSESKKVSGATDCNEVGFLKSSFLWI